ECQCLLESHSSGDSVGGAGEDGEAAISLTSLFQDGAAVVFDAGGEEGIMASEGEAPGVRVVGPQLGAALDGRGEESDCSRGGGGAWEHHDLGAYVQFGPLREG